MDHGFPGAHRRVKKRAPDSSCAQGGLYVSPSAGQTVSSTSPFTIAWNPTCLSPPSGAVDIRLFAPSNNNSLLHVWQHVPYEKGKFTTDLKPKWWGATPSAHLQLTIVEADAASFALAGPPGPFFTVTYTAPKDGTTPASADTSKPDAGISTNVGALGAKPKLAPGKVAAAVIMPLLIVIGLAVAYYVKMVRTKNSEKRKLWSEKVDKRMSTISTDWKSITPAGAKEAMRYSMASNRMSTFGYRQSTAGDTQVPRGYSMYQHENEKFSSDAPHMSQLRPGLRASAFSNTERVSRVSFANDPRPKSGRYLERNEEPLPPLPHMSPEQTEGPLTLTAEDIRARIHGRESNEGRPSVDEVLPALSMMRTGAELSEKDDYLLENPASSPVEEQPQPPIPAQTVERSPVGPMPMQAMPANVMSPDEMLRAYAARARDVLGAPTAPQPAAKYNGSGMRTLYSPAGPAGANVMGGVGFGGRQRQSGLAYEDDHIGTAN